MAKCKWGVGDCKYCRTNCMLHEFRTMSCKPHKIDLVRQNTKSLYPILLPNWITSLSLFPSQQLEIGEGNQFNLPQINHVHHQEITRVRVSHAAHGWPKQFHHYNIVFVSYLWHDGLMLLSPRKQYCRENIPHWLKLSSYLYLYCYEK